MSVTLHTTHGDLKVEIFCEAVPRTAENFLALCASGAYNDTPFHRLIPSFMIQGGDISLSLPSTDSELLPERPSLPFEIPKGGASIHHPEPLEQEIHLPSLRHNARGILSMASKAVKKSTTGSETKHINGSQFFITFAPASHLDGKSTVFGKVLGLGSKEKGEEHDTLTKLENAKVKIDKKGRVVQPGDFGKNQKKEKAEAEQDAEWERIGIERVTIHANPFAE
ncbi:Peptidyl-prolyl cis-trans isomerase cyp10 [Coccidioides posadasii str. Silveira]|uniref:Peptidyl-prolyl cis-trans isomerase n=1 Tax=Coccidioides posadasii (strain RMSCC 757 / Silveira) TaxID=443226 RepID=E9CYU8_COCPS|nr:peptidyl-prolyl cis-trans isomerase [Coccidioides posadasii str. Silveira]QVM07928.1 Peptidyl-prolyl cis-trans isomerase cyp10 [Coccidioides posadasii str. Silveira]